MLDSADDVMAAALHYLGLDPNSTNANDLDLAAALLTSVRSAVRKFHSSEYLNALASGEICLVLGWSGDIKQAQRRAKEANRGTEVGYVIPKGGAQMFFDTLAIPADARNVAEAHEFLNFLMRPEIAARNSNYLGYANGNLASQRLLSDTVFKDPTVYPDAETMRGLYVLKAKDQKTQRLMNRLWTRIKTGR
jgi:putrescine transport system substrate-binding protein